MMVALMVNERLFAKKGEAVPSGIPVRDPAPKRGDGGASALSFLIQRRGSDGKAESTQPTEAPQTVSPVPAPTPISPPAQAAAPLPAATTWHEEDGLADVADYVKAPRLQMAGASLPPDGPDDDPDWRRVSFRLSTGNHRKLRNLARLWGVSGQSLLQTAVANFLDAAVTGDDRNWRH